MAAIVAIALLVHHGSPRQPKDRPADWISPDKVGPNPLHRLAEEAAVPFKVPKTLLEGAELASKIWIGGKARA